MYGFLSLISYNYKYNVSVGGHSTTVEVACTVLYHTVHGFLPFMLYGIICAPQQPSGLCHSFRFITSLRGHVQAVYQIAWSPDSRLLVSGSADSTLKGKPCLYLYSQDKKYADTVNVILSDYRKHV